MKEKTIKQAAEAAGKDIAGELEQNLQALAKVKETVND